jgi:hypothetical protein
MPRTPPAPPEYPIVRYNDDCSARRQRIAFGAIPVSAPSRGRKRRQFVAFDIDSNKVDVLDAAFSENII